MAPRHTRDADRKTPTMNYDEAVVGEWKNRKRKTQRKRRRRSPPAHAHHSFFSDPPHPHQIIIDTPIGTRALVRALLFLILLLFLIFLIAYPPNPAHVYVGFWFATRQTPNLDHERSREETPTIHIRSAVLEGQVGQIVGALRLS
eukprot:6457058-Pyramimonas_sp.AAC.1